MFSCTEHENQKQLNKKEREDLRIDTKILKSFQDSLNSTGDYRYYEKYILKIDEMIKKYPEERGLLQVKESVKEIFGDSTI
jgi:hypothetical protein